MTIRTRIALGVSAAILSLGLALSPAAFAQDKMGKDDGMMKKDTMSKDGMKNDTMSKDDGMKKDTKSKDGRKKDDGIMKKRGCSIVEEALATGRRAPKIRGRSRRPPPEYCFSPNSIERDLRALDLRTLLALRLTGGVAGVSLGLLIGLGFGRLRDGFFGFAGDPRGLERGNLFLKALLLGLFRLARSLCLGALGRKGLALRTLRHNRRIIRPRLRLEFVQKVFACFLCRLLPVGEAWFPKSTHRRTLSSSLSILHHCLLVRRLGIAGAARRRCVYIGARRDATYNRSRSGRRKSPPPTISRSPEKLPNCDVPHKGGTRAVPSVRPGMRRG